MQPFGPFRNLGIGEVILLNRPEIVRTILGSCLAVTMWDPQMRGFAICHAVYAGVGTPGDTHYIEPCLQKMIAFMNRRKITPEETVVKLFGGTETGQGHPLLSNKIVSVAKTFLADQGYTISVEETGGKHGRELYFVPESGSVFIRKVSDKQERLK